MFEVSVTDNQCRSKWASIVLTLQQRFVISIGHYLFNLNVLTKYHLYNSKLNGKGNTHKQIFQNCVSSKLVYEMKTLEYIYIVYNVQRDFIVKAFRLPTFIDNHAGKMFFPTVF